MCGDPFGADLAGMMQMTSISVFQTEYVGSNPTACLIIDLCNPWIDRVSPTIEELGEANISIPANKNKSGMYLIWSQEENRNVRLSEG